MLAYNFSELLVVSENKSNNTESTDPSLAILANQLMPKRDQQSVQGSVLILPEIIQPGGARQSHIADYNFDGYDDVGFSVADAGMGVYQQYTIYLYNPQYHQFYPLEEPEYTEKVKCSCFCDVALDEKKKELRTSCRGGARWWHDIWRFTNGKLEWVSSEAEPMKE